MERIESIINGVINGKADLVKADIENGLQDKLSPTEIINVGLIGGMNVIAERFRNNQIFVPEVMLAAKAMQAGLAIIKPLLAETDHEPLGKIVIGTVKGDQHDIGKNLVSMMWEGAGFEVIDLGSNVPAEKFISNIKEYKPEILGLSALLTTTMPEMQILINKLKEEGLRDEIKVIIGGAPVSQEYANKIGADGYAPDAGMAVEIAKSLLGISKNLEVKLD